MSGRKKMQEQPATPGLKLVKGAKEAVESALLAELRVATEKATAAAQAVEQHNALAQQLQAQYVGANAVVQHVYEKIAKRHKLGPHDGVDLKAGIVKRGHFAPDAAAETKE